MYKIEEIRAQKKQDAFFFFQIKAEKFAVCILIVPSERLELSRLTTTDPKSVAAANYAKRVFSSCLFYI